MSAVISGITVELSIDISTVASETDVRRVFIMQLKCAHQIENAELAEIPGCAEATVRSLWHGLQETASQHADTTDD